MYTNTAVCTVSLLEANLCVWEVHLVHLDILHAEVPYDTGSILFVYFECTTNQLRDKIIPESTEGL